MRTKLLAILVLVLMQTHILAGAGKAITVQSQKDAETVGACQAAFELNIHLINTARMAITRQNGVPDPKIINELNINYERMGSNINDFESFLTKQLIDRAESTGVSREQMMLWRIRAFQYQKAKFDQLRGRVASWPLDSKATLDFGYAATPAAIRCVGWLADQKPIRPA